MDKKDQTLILRLSIREREVMQIAAAARGLTLSSYVRMVALEAAKKDAKR